MGYSPLVIKRMLAYVPRGKKRYVCSLCHKQFSFVDMRLHLEIDHEKKVEGARSDAVKAKLGGAIMEIQLFHDVVTVRIHRADADEQEVGNFLVLLHSGYSKRTALAFNAASSLAMLAGGVLAFSLLGSVLLMIILGYGISIDV